MSFQAPPVTTVVLQDGGAPVFIWARWFQAVATFLGRSLNVITTVPTSSTSTGTPNQVATDGAFIYICTASNTWRRAPLSSF